MTLLLLVALLTGDAPKGAHYNDGACSEPLQGRDTPLQARDPQSPTPAAQFAGKRIVAAEVYLEGQPSTDVMVRDLIETRPGEPLSMADVRETIAHLFSLGRYQDITVEAFEAPEGVRVRFNLEPIHGVEKIEFEGDVKISAGTLRNAITERFGATPTVGRAADVAYFLQEIYNERGYLNAAIRPTVQVLHDPDRSILTFEVNAGPVARVREVALLGDPGEPREVFLDRIHADPGRVYERIEIDKRLAEFVARQRKAGRYEATASHGYRVSDDGQSVNLTVEVDRGPEVTVQFTGDPLPKARLEELVPVAREGAVDIDLLEDSERRIVNYLNQQGYWRASAASTRQQADSRLDVIFNVRQGLQYRIDGGVEVSGQKIVPIEEIRPLLLGLVAGEPFVEANLGAAVSRIRALYLQRGFAQVKVTSAATELNPQGGGGRVKPAITIVEGPLSRIGTVTFAGNQKVPSNELTQLLKSAPGVPYYAPHVMQDVESLTVEYRNRGFAAATIEAAPKLSADSSTIDLTFHVVEGPQTVVDHILIVGNVRTNPETILREVQFKTGEPLGLSDLIATRSRIAALGLFRRVQITEIPHAGSDNRDVLITVEESAATTLGFGGGLEVSRRLQRDENTGTAQQQIEFAPRGFFEVGRRNLGGRNRSVNLYMRLALRPDPNSATGDGGQFGFEEYRVIGTYRQPRTLGRSSEVIFTGAIEQGVRSSFNFARKGVTAEVMRTLDTRRNIRVNGRYTLGTTKTFDVAFDVGTPEGDIVTIERVFPQVRLSAFSSAISRDSRDDVVDPTKGWFVSGEGSMAARALGGEVGFIKSYTQALFFHRIPVKRRVVFAGRVALGLADGFPRQVPRQDAQGQPIEGQFVTIEDLPASERFFAGGDSTIRGFPLDSVGAEKTITPAGFPRGGNAVILLNAEVRFPVWGDFGGVVFVDGGNVFERATQLDLGNLRGSVGFGARYRSPIGPIRLDLGFKLDRRTTGLPEEGLTGIHFRIGHAF